MEQFTHKIHWLAFTVHARTEAAYKLYDEVFRKHLGDLVSSGHGGRGFKIVENSLCGFKLYTDPISGEYFHFELPGEACDLLPWTSLQHARDYLEMEHPEAYKFNRVDIAFDYVAFTPDDVEEAIRAGDLRSLAKRQSLTVIESPFETRDNGELGTKTVTFGSGSSERLIRIYNRRGYNRIEFQARDKRAHLVAEQVLMFDDVQKWGKLAIGHLRDFVDFKTDWWEQFVNGISRAGITLSNPKETSMSRIYTWLDKQVGPALSVLNDGVSEEAIKTLVDRGRRRRNDRYNALLAISNISSPGAATLGDGAA